MKTRIEKIQELVSLLIKKWRLLNERTELLRPALTNQGLVQWHVNSGKGKGFDLIRLSLAELCLIHTSALLKSPHDTDVSLSSIINDLRNNAGDVYRTLRQNYSEPIPSSNSIANGKLDSAVCTALEKHYEKEELKRNENRFDEEVKNIVTHYSRLMEKDNGLGDKILTIRHRVLAHFGTRDDQDKRVLFSSTDSNLIVGNVFEIVDQIGSLCQKCASVICNTAWRLDDFKQDHKAQSLLYWGLEQAGKNPDITPTQHVRT